VAVDEAGLAGFVLGEIQRPGVGGIVFLHVRRDMRRQGVARALTAEVAAALEAGGVEWIHLEVENDNPVAGVVYERWGFEPCASLLLVSTGELRRRL
jgi:ribosomal protein S18 acetylase RimI-like enzyme